MTGIEYDYYSDEERPVALSAQRERLVRAFSIAARILAVVGLGLVLASYLDAAFVHHKDSFPATGQFNLALAGASVLVLAANTFFWSWWLRGTVRGTILTVIALAIISPVVVFLLTLAINLTASQLGQPALVSQ